MSGFYQRMAAVAERMFASDKFTDAVLTRSASATSTFDPITGTVDHGSDDRSIMVRALARESTTRASDGSLVTNTILTLNIEPQAGDALAIGMMTYTVGNVSTVAPDGSPILYRATVAG